MSYWSSRRVLVTGGAGFLGSHVVNALRDAGCTQITIVRSRDYDLTKENDVVRLFRDVRADVVIHLAGLVGGILANRERPADFFYQNLTMGTLLLNYSAKAGIEKFVAAGTGCSYPENAPVPLRESSFWDGLPQGESAPYSLAKRLLHIQSQAYYTQHGFVSVIALPGNIYGPYDNFDLLTSHVVPALVRKFVDAVENKEKEVSVWGSGIATRDFVYGADVAEGILLAGEKYSNPDLVNLSSGVETSIRELAELIAEITGFRGAAVWDTTRPDGQRRRVFDVTKARCDLGWTARTSLRKGLELTVDWFRANRVRARLGSSRGEPS